MRRCARAIVIKDDSLLVMKRFKVDREYFTLLGGAVEQGESPDQAALREVREESGVSIRDPRLVFVEEAGDPYGDQYIYLCEYVDGDPALPADSEEAFWSRPGVNTYEPQWLPIDVLPDVPFMSPSLRNAILTSLQQGWPENPYRIFSKDTARPN